MSIYMSIKIPYIWHWSDLQDKLLPEKKTFTLINQNKKYILCSNKVQMLYQKKVDISYRIKINVEGRKP